jgi:GGDEF domain-containing protein
LYRLTIRGIAPVYYQGKYIGSVECGQVLDNEFLGRVKTLIKYADAAMYKAKEAGRDNYKFYQPDIK